MMKTKEKEIVEQGEQVSIEIDKGNANPKVKNRLFKNLIRTKVKSRAERMKELLFSNDKEIEQLDKRFEDLKKDAEEKFERRRSLSPRESEEEIELEIEKLELDTQRLKLQTKLHNQTTKRVLSSKKETLQKHLNVVKYNFLTNPLGKVAGTIIISFSLYGILSLNIFSQVWWLAIVGVILGTGLILTSKSIKSKEELLSEIADVDDELFLLELEELEQDKRAEKQFRNHQQELKRYYDANLGQLKSVFSLGIIVIIAGIIITVASVILFYFNENVDTIIAVAGMVSGILVDAVGAVFINMYVQTAKTSTEFHTRMVQSNNNFFANVLIAKINDEELQNKTFAEVAKIVSANGYKLPENDKE